jgi:SAM-dependent methyltransferase
MRRRRARRYGYPRLDFPWRRSHYNRTALVAAVASIIGATRYLEIGCDDDATFDAVPLLEKTGVDPVSGGTHRMTSDEYFAQSAEKFDLIFLDGLHTYEQTSRDIANARRRLTPGGVIIVDDCLPASYDEQAVPRSQRMWTGDVWRAVFEVKQSEDVDVRVVSIDHGCAVVLNRPSTDLTGFGTDDFASLDFGFYVENYERLGLITFPDALRFVEEYAAG